LLIDCLLHRLEARLGRRFTGVEPASMARLVDFSWPGNIRQLLQNDEQQMIEQARKETCGRVSRPSAAASLGVPASTLESKIKTGD
jgi:DNA-binding NtrC family response regulator